MSIRACCLAFALVLAPACAPEPAVSTESLVLGDRELVVQEVTSRAPPGGDGPAHVRLAIRRGQRLFELDGEALDGVLFGETVLVLEPDGTLERISQPGSAFERRIPIDQGVVVAPVRSADGRFAAWVRAHDAGGQALVVMEADGTLHELARGLGSIGAIRFESGVARPRIVFVGAREGGVAGLWATRVGDEVDARCLTNCELRTGEPWGSRHVPLPDGEPRFEGEALVFESAGVQRRIRLPEALR